MYFFLSLVQGGRLLVINGGTTLISRVITYNPAYPFIRPFKGVITLLINW